LLFSGPGMLRALLRKVLLKRRKLVCAVVMGTYHCAAARIMLQVEKTQSDYFLVQYEGYDEAYSRASNRR
jgi:hypothetical protein